MSTVTIGQDSPAVTFIEGQLESDGAKLAQAALLTVAPWTGLPVISFFVGIVINDILKYVMTWADRAAYAAFVSAKTQVQISVYLKAKETGSQADIDAAADKLIHLGGM